MPRLESIEATCNSLLGVAELRQQLLLKQKRAQKVGEKPQRIPRGVRIGARRFRTAYHLLKEREQVTSHKIETEKVPSLRDQLIQLREAAKSSLYNKMNKTDPTRYAELRLQITWADSRLRGDKPVVIERNVEGLCTEIYFQGLRRNNWLSQAVDRDDNDGPVLRHQVLRQQWDAALVQPSAKGFGFRG